MIFKGYFLNLFLVLTFGTWIVALTTDCGKGYLSATYDLQNLTSPNYPKAYPSNASCVWRIYSSYMYVNVYISVLFLDMENSSGCVKDNLTIYEDHRGLEKVTEICGTMSERLHFRLETDVYVIFNSDSSTEGGGFVLQYGVKDDIENDNYHPRGYSNYWGTVVIVVFSITIVFMIVSIAVACFYHHKRGKEEPIQSFSGVITEENRNVRQIKA